MITTAEYLKQAKALIKDRDNFTKQHHMVDINGDNSDWSMISPWEKKPAKFGIYGALDYVRIKNKVHNADEWDDEIGWAMCNHLIFKAGRLAKEYMRCGGGHLGSMTNWIYDFQSSKKTTHKEVLNFFDVLIAMEKFPKKKYVKELSCCGKCKEVDPKSDILKIYEGK